jgi:hypothetical protein
VSRGNVIPLRHAWDDEQSPGRPATAADVEALAAELRRLREQLAWLTRVPELFAAPARLPPAGPPPARDAGDGADLVDLDQMAAMVRLKKRSLERRAAAMPAPRRKGTRGQRSLWAWREVRPWLEATFGLLMPEEYPGARRALR